MLNVNKLHANPTFSQYPINLPFDMYHKVMAADLLADPGLELIMLGANQAQKRQLAIYKYDLVAKTYVLHEQLMVNDNVFAIDFGVVNKAGLQNLYLLTKNRILKYQPLAENTVEKMQELLAISSMYLAEVADSLRQQDFANDINQDFIDDFTLAGFETFNLWLSNGEKGYIAQSLAIPAKHELENNSIRYQKPELFFHDMNQDGKTDLVQVQQGQLKVYQQNLDASFDLAAESIAIAPSIYGINWWEMTGPNGQGLDQSDLKHRQVKSILDLNADSLPDLAVQYTQSSGVLDKVIEFEFYYAYLKDGKLEYAQQADAKVVSDETLSDIRFLDINSDAKLEVIVSAFDIGISQIIGALLSGSIDQNLLIFAMDQQGQYPKKPLLSQEVEMSFSLSSGSRGEPLIKVIDVNADQHLDVVYSDGENSLRVLMATPNAKGAFAKRSISQKVSMPYDASNVLSTDLNRDGKTDLVIHYGREDDAALLNQVVVLMAN
ncbi:FG-GAP repeat domain-containing protein [Paraglaciecola aestuariivivens]